MKEELEISDFLNNEYKNYSLYVIESRAIPGIDGLKPVQRKAIFVADKHVRNISNKVATLAGKVISESAYHHGNVSAEDAITGMAQTFKNSIPLLEGIGQFGSLRSPIASSSRYISVKLLPIFDKIYKDKEILEFKEEEGQKIEPRFYLPLIPMVLLNGGSGIAIGYASNILNREPIQVIKDCISYLKGGKISKLKPYLSEFKGTYTNDPNNHKKWLIQGIFEIENTTTVRITELPPSMTYEKIENHLDSLLDKREIVNWENAGKGKIDYIIKYTREKLATMSKEDIDKHLKLSEYESENFTVLDEHGKLKIFDSAENILKYFVDFRLKYFYSRQSFQLNKIKNDIFKLEQQYKFVKAVIDGKILINNKKKDEIEKSIIAQKIEKFNDSYDFLLQLPIYSLTKEKLENLTESIKDKKVEEKTIKASVPKEVYIAELEQLLKEIK